MPLPLRVADLGELDAQTPVGKSWEQLVSASPYAGFMQSLHWADIKRRQGFQTLHLGVFASDELIGGAIFYMAPNSKGAGFLVAPDGPVLPWHNESLATQAMELLRQETRLRAHENGCMAMRIAPRLVSCDNPSTLQHFQPAPLAINEHHTLFIDLRQSQEHLLAAMKPKARYNIGLAARNNVHICEATGADGAGKLFDVMEVVAERNEFFVEPYVYFASLLNSDLPNDLIKLFIAEHDGDILGALLMVAYGDRATYLSGGTTDIKRNLMAGYALQWEAMRAAKALGCTYYDFWGYDASLNPEHAYAGFSRFKSQFGGQPMEFIGTLDHYFADRLADAIIRAFREISEVPA